MKSSLPRHWSRGCGPLKIQHGRLTSRETPGDPEGAQKSTKDRHFVKKTRSERGVFVDFCAQSHCLCFFHDFRFDLSLNIEEKSKKKDMYFFIAALVFLNMATLTKHRILRYESKFFIFRVLRFFTKMHQTKITSNAKSNFGPPNPSKI